MGSQTGLLSKNEGGMCDGSVTLLQGTNYHKWFEAPSRFEHPCLSRFPLSESEKVE